MDTRIRPPIFTLRGHNFGVTALTQCIIADNPYLVSGDEEGSLIVWDLSTFRRYISYPKLIKSRVQSLKMISLCIRDEAYHQVLVAQSRDHGIQLFDLNQCFRNPADLNAKYIASFPSYKSLFSRGDAKNIDNSRAILAHPAYLENYLVTIRVLGSDAETVISGSAQRYASDSKNKNSSVFDLRLKEDQVEPEGYFLFVAYEDGCLCVYKFRIDTTTTIPSLNSTGLKIDLINTFDLKINDFVAAFDVNVEASGAFIAVCGSPLKSLTFLTGTLEQDSEPMSCQVSLKKQGVSSICMVSGGENVLVSGWDSTVKLYSLRSQQLLATQSYHSKQVQDMLLTRRPDNQLVLDDGGSGNVEHLLCCASAEGTVSISVVY